METANQTPFLESLSIQARVIGALVIRELLNYNVRRNLGFLWIFLTPIVFTVIITVFHSSMKSSPSSHGGLPFVAVGITGFNFIVLMRQLPRDCANACQASRLLLLHRHVRPLDLLFARIIRNIAAVTFSLLVLTAACVLMGFISPLDDCLKALIAWILLVWLMSGFGLSLGLLLARYSILRRFMILYNISLMIFSGAVIMVDWLPISLQQLLLWFPPVHGMEMLREGYLGSDARAHYDITYLVSWSMFMTFIGLALPRESRGTDLEE